MGTPNISLKHQRGIPTMLGGVPVGDARQSLMGWPKRAVPL